MSGPSLVSSFSLMMNPSFRGTKGARSPVLPMGQLDTRFWLVLVNPYLSASWISTPFSDLTMSQKHPDFGLTRGIWSKIILFSLIFVMSMMLGFLMWGPGMIWTLARATGSSMDIGISDVFLTIAWNLFFLILETQGMISIPFVFSPAGVTIKLLRWNPVLVSPSKIGMSISMIFDSFGWSSMRQIFIAVAWSWGMKWAWTDPCSTPRSMKYFPPSQ